MAIPSSNSPSRSRAVVAGVLGAGAALVAGELVTALGHDRPSLVASVGNRFIDQFAAPLKELAVRLFGTNDKPALVVGIVVSSLLLGGLLGMAARRRFAVAVAGFAAFGVVGVWAFTSDARGGGALGYVAGAIAVGSGIWVTRSLLAAARKVEPLEIVTPVPSSPPGPPLPGPALPGTALAGAVAEPIIRPDRPNRRAFLIRSAAVTTGIVAAAAIARNLGGDGAAATARKRTLVPRPRSSRPVPAGIDLPDLAPYITPNADFYRIDTAIVVPDVDPASWSLTISGMVDEPYSITYEELVELATVAEPVTLQCVSNEVGGDLVGTAVWQGVPLIDLLERAGVQPGATQIVGRSVDGWAAGFPTELAGDGRVAMVAVAMNGEPLPVRNGFPARLVVSGLYGYVSATKWLEEIELTTWEDFDGYWIPRGWSKEGPIKTASRIDVPRSGPDLVAGRQAVAGVAWAPDRGISKVEVQIDDGPWVECRLGDVASEHTWVQWVYEWDAPEGDHVVRARATDGDGKLQTEDRAEPAPNGATGWPERRVTVVTG